MNQLEKMRELVDAINSADTAYYQHDEPSLTDRAYDELVLELTMLEKITGVHFSDSPIGKVPADTKTELETVRHSKPMLSCNKTKDVNDLVLFAKRKDCLLTWKMDGLTLVLRYKQGKLVQAITRGKDGLVGEDVTHTVREMRNVPSHVPCKDDFEVRGEGVVSWEDYKILAKLDDKSSHPRSMAAGAVRSFVADLGKLNHLDFFAFELIKEEHEPPTKLEQLAFLKDNGFDVVEYLEVYADEKASAIIELLEQWTPEDYAYPVDGIVAEYNDIAFGRSLGATAHHEKRMLALKWQDELKETTFRGVELHTTRSGKVSIVGVFDEVTIDGTKFHRANLHNLSTFESYRFGVGDTITVYKANKIVPQIAQNKMLSGTYVLPRFCPSCGEELTVQTSLSGVRNLYCPNEACVARNANRIAAYCGAMGIHGISASVAENMVAYGWINHFKDLYHLELYREEIANTPGFGADWYSRIHEAIESARTPYMSQFLQGLGIPAVGADAALRLHEYYNGSMTDLEKAAKKKFAFSHIEGISPRAEAALHEWFGNPANLNMLHELMTELQFSGVVPKKITAKNPFHAAKVALSGVYKTLDKNGMAELLKSLGALVSKEITEETEFFIYGDMPNSKLVSQAIKQGTTMMSEEKFAEMLEQEL